MRRHALSSVVFLGLLAGCVATGPEKTSVVSKQWDASSIRRVEVEGVNGKVNIKATAANRVDLIATVHHYGRDDRRDGASSVVLELRDGTLFIHDRNETRHSWWFPLLKERKRIDYDVTIPAAMPVAATSVNGTIVLAGMTGNDSLHSVNGAIQATKPAGELEAHTVNGRVSARFETSFAGANLQTVNGAISVELPNDASFAYDVSQVNGSFRSNIPVTVGDNGGAVNGGKYRLEMSTVNGSVTLSQHAGRS